MSDKQPVPARLRGIIGPDQADIASANEFSNPNKQPGLFSRFVKRVVNPWSVSVTSGAALAATTTPAAAQEYFMVQSPSAIQAETLAFSPEQQQTRWRYEWRNPGKFNNQQDTDKVAAEMDEGDKSLSRMEEIVNQLGHTRLIENFQILKKHTKQQRLNPNEKPAKYASLELVHTLRPAQDQQKVSFGYGIEVTSSSIINKFLFGVANMRRDEFSPNSLNTILAVNAATESYRYMMEEYLPANSGMSLSEIKLAVESENVKNDYLIHGRNKSIEVYPQIQLEAANLGLGDAPSYREQVVDTPQGGIPTEAPQGAAPIEE